MIEIICLILFANSYYDNDESNSNDLIISDDDPLQDPGTTDAAPQPETAVYVSLQEETDIYSIIKSVIRENIRKYYTL